MFAMSPGGTSRPSAPRSPRDRPVARLRDRLAQGPIDSDDQPLYRQIAEQITTRRQDLRLSQAELASLCDTTQSAIARLESGGRPPRIDTLLRIAGALDCDLRIELRPRTRRKGVSS